MKKTICILLGMLILGGFAMAESKYAIAPDTPVSMDLDGNGTTEKVAWTMAEQDDHSDPQLTVTVTADDGAEYVYETYIWSSEGVYALDVDHDGLTEILITGDELSDDYATYCLRYEDGVLYELLFADANRGENTDGYYKAGYGKLVGVGKGTLTLSGSQDVLGTWFGTRKFTLTPYGRLELNDGGWWLRDIDTDDPEIWEYAAMTLAQDLNATVDGKAAVLETGDRLLITGSNKIDAASFITEDGRTGTLDISHDYEKGWGHCVNGISEIDMFEYVFYAD